MRNEYNRAMTRLGRFRPSLGLSSRVSNYQKRWPHMLMTASRAVSRQMLHSNAELSCVELLLRLVGCEPVVSSCRPLSDEDANDDELIVCGNTALSGKISPHNLPAVMSMF